MAERKRGGGSGLNLNEMIRETNEVAKKVLNQKNFNSDQKPADLISK